MKTSCFPLFTLVLLLAASVATMLFGVVLAKRQVTEREPVGRAELSEFGGVLVEELRRLDTLYDGHVRALASSIERGSEIALRAQGEHLVGIRQISIIPKQGRGLHAEYAAADGTDTPLPVIVGNDKERIAGRETFELDPEKLSGWVGEWFFDYRFDLGAYAVIKVDREVVNAATRDRVAAWYGEEFEPVAATGASVQIESPAGHVLAADVARPADFVLPLKTRFGRWKLSAWDEVTTSVSYHQPTLTASAMLALGLALLGVGVSYHQRKWQRLAEQRVSFVNRVSHELRTPLTNILLNADLAQDSLESSSRDTARRLGLVREEAGRLSRLIGNVLSFSKEDNGGPEVRRSPFGMEGMVEIVLAPFRPALRRRGIEVEIDIERGTTALGDADACAQIMANLVSNVEKYAASGGWLGITAGTDTEGVWIAVEDRGHGIPADAGERIFGAFERLGERVDEGVTGTGLGLAIARDLARRMGGELIHESRGEGARFVLKLPSAPENVVSLEDSKAS